jgi:uncharacterized protein
MYMKKNLFLIFILFSVCVSAQIEKIIPPAPSPPRLVNDNAGLLTKEQTDYLERKLVAYDDSTSNQVAIVIVPDLKGYTANEYAIALGRKWGVGGSQFSNGVVILISTGGGAGNRDAYIAVGYGLEGAIPDITAKAIVENEIIPNFKAGNYYRGLNSAVDAILKAAAGEYKASIKIDKKWIGKIIGIIIFLTIIIVAIAAKKGGGGGMVSRRGFGEFGTGWIIGSMMSGGGKGGGGWSGGGGGFGGFGGGSFGGGGAGGKW